MSKKFKQIEVNNAFRMCIHFFAYSEHYIKNAIEMSPDDEELKEIQKRMADKFERDYRETWEKMKTEERNNQ